MSLPKVGGSVTWSQTIDPEILTTVSLGEPVRTLTWTLNPATGPEWRTVQALMKADDGTLDATKPDYLRAAVALCVESVTDSGDGVTHVIEEDDLDGVVGLPHHITNDLGWVIHNLNVAGIAATGKETRSASSDRPTRTTGT